MNKKAIRNTAICYWSEEDETFVVESPLFETIAGIGVTEEDSWKVFDNLLDDAYEAYLEGRVPGYERPGRPAKGGVALNIDVKSETKELIKNLANDFQCSQGEIIDFLTFAYRKRNEHSDPYVQKKKQALSGEQLSAVFEKMHGLKVSIADLETSVSAIRGMPKRGRTKSGRKRTGRS